MSAIPAAIAVLLPREGRALARVGSWLVGSATRALLGTAFLHLIPEASASSSQQWSGVLLLIGFLAFFLTERYVWRHQHSLRQMSR